MVTTEITPVTTAGRQFVRRKVVEEQKPAVEILLVEDNPADVRILQEAFEIAGLEAHWSVAQDGEEAIEFVHQRGAFRDAPRPNLVLLDLNLPRVDGRYVLAQIKAHTKYRQIPVFVFSTSTRQEDIDEAYALLANCYVPKPMDIEVLIKLGEQIKSFWLEMARLPQSRESNEFGPLAGFSDDERCSSMT